MDSVSSLRCCVAGRNASLHAQPTHLAHVVRETGLGAERARGVERALRCAPVQNVVQQRVRLLHPPFARAEHPLQRGVVAVLGSLRFPRRPRPHERPQLRNLVWSVSTHTARAFSGHRLERRPLEDHGCLAHGAATEYGPSFDSLFFSKAVPSHFSVVKPAAGKQEWRRARRLQVASAAERDTGLLFPRELVRCWLAAVHPAVVAGALPRRLGSAAAQRGPEAGAMLLRSDDESKPHAAEGWYHRWRAAHTLCCIVCTAAVVAACLAAGASPAGDKPAAPSAPEMLALALAVAFFGIPHGATDHLVGDFLCRPLCPRAWLIPFVAGYLALMGAVVLCWAALPTLSLAAFLAMSVVHWGLGDVEDDLLPRALLPVEVRCPPRCPVSTGEGRGVSD